MKQLSKCQALTALLPTTKVLAPIIRDVKKSKSQMLWEIAMDKQIAIHNIQTQPTALEDI